MDAPQPRPFDKLKLRRRDTSEMSEQRVTGYLHRYNAIF